MTQNPRKTAAAIIACWLQDRRQFPDRMFQSAHDHRAFVMELVYGTVRRHLTLDWLLKQYVRRMPGPETEALLHTGLYELYYMETEPYAAVNETVAMAAPKFRGLVNAVLRRAAREKAVFPDKLATAPLPVQHSFPEALFHRWSDRYGLEKTEQLCARCNVPPATSLRINTAVIAPDLFLEKCREADIALSRIPGGGGLFYTLPRGVAVEQLPGYAHGWFWVQDPSTAIAMRLLAPRPGERILDACAAPGGKTAAMAALLASHPEADVKSPASLIAMDLHEDRLTRLRETLDRLGFDQVEVRRGDASVMPPPEERDRFDAILLDAPCTNTGVLRRRADARWRFSIDRMKQLQSVQRALLDACSCYVKPGGRLVYSTCSLEPEENEHLVREWVDHRLDFELAGSKQVLPSDHADGAFAALLVRDAVSGAGA